jgi:calcineurin-like phosphoesterase family protein
MNKTMILSWNKVVGPEDIVYFLGDFAMKASKTQIFNILDQLNGTKYFIKGNHDRSHILNSLVSNGKIEWWKYNYDFSYDYKGKTYDFCLSHHPHYPIGGSEIICLFGHIHERILEDNKYNMLNLSVENIGYEPISIETIIESVERKKLILGI